MNSAVYTGKVRHHRFEPVQHDMTYKIYLTLIDLDEIDEISAKVSGFSTRRRAMFGFNPQLHGPRDGSSLRAWAEARCREAGVDIEGGPIRLLAYPQILGYAFDPITEWYCHDRSGKLAAIIHEVRNTFGDYHSYIVPIGDESPHRHRVPKRMHVSPFNKVEGDYLFTTTEPKATVSTIIDYVNNEGNRVMTASFAGVRQPFTTWTLWRRFFDHPLLTFRVMVGIHFEAWRLWRKGLRINRTPQAPLVGTTVVVSQNS